jgi:hypothetical protein
MFSRWIVTNIPRIPCGDHLLVCVLYVDDILNLYLCLQTVRFRCKGNLVNDIKRNNLCL